ncbi:MAG: sigma-70 family RNA polymerase sigma factor [Acidobacteria bacterium]|nr:sigma-70 family RNA polymerase sigma factor [Acidobacteriota bacterium]
MFFSRSIAFDDEDQIDAVAAAQASTVFPNAESRFIDKLKEGDGEAFDDLIGLYSADVYGMLCRLTENPEEAADLTQETFLSALTAIKGFRGDAGLKTWLFRIAINHSRNRFRWWKRRRRDVTVSLDAEIGNSETKVHETLSDKGKSPEDLAIANEREAALMTALSSLPDIFREAIVLCDLECLSYEEISGSLGLNIGTVKSRIARGREELRRKLKDF